MTGEQVYIKDKGEHIIPLLDTQRPIAVVEDSIDDQASLRHELRFLFGQAPVLTFRNGSDLIYYLLQHPHGDKKPWLIVLDLHMPEMGGFRTLEFLRGRSDFYDIPVVVVSGTQQDGEIASALQNGARAFLAKPVTRRDFAGLLGNSQPPATSPRDGSGRSAT